MRALIGLWLAATLLGAAPSAAQDGEPAPVGTEAGEPAQPIVPSQIALEADRLARELRTLERILVPSAGTTQIAAQLPEVADRITQQQEQAPDWMAEGAALATLASAEGAWQALRLQLPGWLDELTNRLGEISRGLANVDREAKLWQRTEEQLEIDSAPAALRTSVNGVREQLSQLRERLLERRSELLTLQASVIEQDSRVERALDDIAAYRLQLVGRIFDRDRVPLWHRSALEPITDQFGERVGAAAAESGTRVAQFLDNNGGAMAAHVALLLLLVAALRSARDRVRERSEEEHGLSRVADVFEAPHAVALLIAMTASFWIYPYIPSVLVQLIFAAALLPTVVLLRRFTPQAFRPLLNALMAFYLLDRVRDLSAPVPSLGRVIFVLEMLIAAALLGWLLRPGRLHELPAYAARGPLYLLGLASRAALALIGVALVAEVMGYSRLGHLLGGGVLESAYVGVVLFAAVRISDSLVTFALRVQPLGALGMVKRSRYAMSSRIHRFSVVVAVLVWVTETLDLFAVQQPVFNAIMGTLTASLSVGSLNLSLADLLAFGVTIWLSFVVSKFVRFALEEDVYPHLDLARGVPYAASTFVHYVLLAVGFFIAVAATGMDLNRFALLAGAFGVGIGFGLQNIVDNFVSGLILLTERPVKVGDTIETNDGILGDVKRIGIRSSTVRTWTGAELIVPNGQLISERVTNWTLSDKFRRIEVTVGVAYGSDVDAVLELLRRVAAENEDLLDEPPPRALFRGFGDSSLDFELRGWTGRFDEFAGVQSALNVSINRRLAEAGIEIPFPQRDLHVRSVDPEAGRRLTGETE